MNKILAAAQFAARAHSGQVRKYTERPYITHPARVAAMAMTLPYADEVMVCAAWLHDTVEDCGVAAAELAALFGQDVADVVCELTHTPKSQVPHLGRAQRKALDRNRLEKSSLTARRIKLLDRIDNLREMDEAPLDFLGVYVNESQLLLDESLRGADDELERTLRAEIARLNKRLATGLA